MFRGNHPTRVDEKGRLKVPAEFKRVIDEKYGTQFYITSLDGKVAQVYPFEEWERIEQKLAGLSTFNPTKKKFLDRVNYYGQVVEMDGQGRLLIPQLLRDSAQIKGEGGGFGEPKLFNLREPWGRRPESPGGSCSADGVEKPPAKGPLWDPGVWED